MGRLFLADTATVISHSDISTGASRFDYQSTWSICCHFTLTDAHNDEYALVAKWGAGVTEKQFLLRVDNPANARDIEIYHNDTLIISGGTDMSNSGSDFGLWKQAVVTCDGASSPSTLTLYTHNMDGTVLDNGTTGTISSNDTTLTHNLQFGRSGSGSDEADGAMANVALFSFEMTLRDCLEYLECPHRFVARHRQSCEFFVPLHGSLSPEPDFSGSGNGSWTVTGTINAHGNPPVGLWYGLDLGPREAAAGGAVKSISATVTGASTVTAKLNRLASIPATVTGASTVTVTLNRLANIPATITGASTVTVLLGRIMQLSGTVTGASTVTAVVEKAAAVKEISGTITGASTVTVQLNRLVSLSGTITGASTVTVQLNRLADLSGTVTGTSTVTAIVTIVAPTAKEISGTITGSSVVTAQLNRLVSLSGTVTGASTFTVVVGIKGLFDAGVRVTVSYPPGTERAVRYPSGTERTVRYPPGVLKEIVFP